MVLVDEDGLGFQTLGVMGCFRITGSVTSIDLTVQRCDRCATTSARSLRIGPSGQLVVSFDAASARGSFGAGNWVAGWL